VHRAASAAAGGSVTLSIDSNEGHAGPAAVREYLHALERIDPAAYRSVAYLEQPTSREIQREAFDWRPVTAHKPVLLDEGLTDLEILPIARRQGWSGLALKTCKGHSLLLASAAWAQHNGLALTLQDLTNPGIGLIHAALVGARLPTLNGVELNSPQFTPAANREFLPRLSPLFEPRDGVHRLPQSVPPGLGSCL
jgi:L-alanine-DL-glutamate epimerase-like enolase superfamily enzyme